MCVCVSVCEWRLVSEPKAKLLIFRFSLEISDTYVAGANNTKSDHLVIKHHAKYNSVFHSDFCFKWVVLYNITVNNSGF